LPSIISNFELIIVPLDENYDLSSFSCASSELNDFLKDDALNDQANLISRTSLCFWKGELVGYITLAVDTIGTKEVYVTDGLECYKYNRYPGIKIARFAVDSGFERRGIGNHLLFAAIGKVLSICNSVGCRYILVDSKKESTGFYEKYGFKIAERNKKRDFIPMYLNMQPIVAKMNLKSVD
jgi:GNAT superfamily N-acetyltransferase